ncbi:MAG: hypothetical protein ACOCUS_01765, partial [Polyangiales bacterium]
MVRACPRGRATLLTVALMLAPPLAGCADGGGSSDGSVPDADGSAPPDAPRTDGTTLPDAVVAATPSDGDTRDDAGPEECGVTRGDPSSPPDGASWRYGGGVGYPDMVPSDGPCTTVVRTRAELESALEAAEADEVVYVADDARIDLTGVTLCIPGGVTLASGRGRG